MRLPWPFGRSQAAPAETEPKTDAGASAPEPAAAPTAAPTAPPTGAWSKLPPIQRVTREAPLVAPASTFLADVPGANHLPPIVGQLGHDVTPLAPAGLVAAPVHAVPSLTSQASLVGRPVQRHAAEAAPEPEPELPLADVPVQRSPAASPAAPASTSAPAGASAVTVAAPGPDSTPSAGPAASDEPIRHLSVVSPGAAAEVPRRSLTRVDAWTPTPSPDRPLVHRTNVQASAQSAEAPAAATPGATRTTASKSTETAGVRFPVAAAADPPAGASGDAQPVPSARRPGLGAPLASAPSTAVQRAPLRLPPGRTLVPSGEGALDGLPGLPVNPTAGSSPLRTTIQRRGAAARVAASSDGPDVSVPVVSDRAGSRQAPYVGSPLSGDLPELPVVSRSGGHGAAEDDHELPPSAMPGPGAPDHVGRTSASMPLVASTAATGSPARPAPAATAQRTSAAAPSVPAAAERRPLVGARPLRPSSASPVGADEPDTAASPAQPSLPGLAANAPGDGPAAIWSNPLVQPTPAFATIPGQPASDVAGTPAFAGQLARPATAGPAPQVQPSRRDGSPMTLARPQAAIAAAIATQGAPSQAPASAAATGPIAGPNGTTIVQMTPAQALATPVIAPTATAIVQRADGSPPPVEGDEGSERSEGELEELARALFPRFQRQLRMEYVYEREARGLPFDS